MAEEQQAEGDGCRTPAELKDSDLFLRTLVVSVDVEERSLPLTLQSGGMLVSGDLVGVRKYFAGIEQQLMVMVSASAEDRTKLTGVFTRLQWCDDDILNGADYRPRYIHLRDAAIIMPNGTSMVQICMPWWRGRLDAIAAFVLGKPFSA